MSQPVYALVEQLNLPVRIQSLAYAQELAIVMYHGVVRDPLPIPDWCFIREEQFAEQMHYLARHTRVLPLHTALKELRSGALDKPTVAITFDDGFQSVYDIAFPVLKDLSLPAAVFLATGFIDTPRTIWFCELIQSLSTTSREGLTWRGVQYDLRGANARTIASGRLQGILKELNPDALRDALHDIQLLLDVSGSEVQEASAPFRMLDSGSIAHMTASGLVEFGAHTESHSILTRIEDPQRALNEIRRSVERTAAFAGAPCRLFAYPNGRKQDYDQVAMEALQDAGIVGAVTTVYGPNTGETPALELRRYGADPEVPPGRFQLDVHHLRSRLTRTE